LVGLLVAGTTRLELDLASPQELTHAVRVGVLDAVALAQELVGLRDGGDLPPLHSLLKLLEGFGSDQFLAATLADPAL
jgi:hypothetical protein